ncbi:MAG TPA: type III pantothenate kinase [Epsilonproteobacteria bacterium]|nr:type III pantothenate kinase [Campylobacterota bacterium]HHD78612.1 type III pantothenate kinase [Campylobacterota bacterium]
MMNKILLADIGNTHFHIYDGEQVEHLSYGDAIKRYANTPLQYISVKESLGDKLEHIKAWENISSQVHIDGEYETMGVDRKALCLSHENGVFVDAGSAITVDVVEEGKYKGGFILPGLKAYLTSYQSISPVLDVDLEEKLSLSTLPFTTKEQISYGIIASIKALIEKHSEAKTLYFTGGDGQFLSGFFEDANYDEMLVFHGMQKALGVMG